MDFDIIDGLASEGIEALHNGAIPRVFAILGEIKGHANALMTFASIWDLVQADYESGIKPKRLQQKYQAHGITLKQIYTKAYEDRWISTTKLKKVTKPSRNKSSNVFYPKCRECEREFEAYSGAAIICPTCKAFKTKAEGTAKLVNKEN